MTDEQFERIMKKLDELKVAQPMPIYIGYPVPTAPPMFPAPLPYRDDTGYCPAHWGDYGARD